MAPTPSPRAADPLAALPRLDRHRPKGPPVRRSKASRWRVAVLLGVHVLIGLHLLHWALTGRSLSPVEPSESMQTVEVGIVNAGFVFFLVAIATTLVFGRWFCGWACHVVALQDASAWLLGRFGLRPRPLRSRLLVLAPWAVAFYMFVWPVVHHWIDPVAKPLPAVADWQWRPTTDDMWSTFPGPLMAVLTFVVVGFVIVWWLGAKGFCTHGCPYGAFFATADRFAPMRIRVDQDACEHCGHCTQVCSSNVRVHEEVAKHGMVVDPGCMKCMDCVSVCPKDALHVGFGAVKPFAISQQRVGARADLSWGEEVLVAVVGVGAFFALRGAWFGEGVPLLMAVGLAAITAVVALLAFRLLRRRDVTFQHAALRMDGRLRPRGRVALTLALTWLAFVAHTGVVTSLADAAFERSTSLLRRQNLARGSVPRDAFAANAQELECVDALAVWTPPRVLAAKGLVLRELGRDDEALADLRRMVARRGLDRYRLPEADVALAIYEGKAGNVARAEELAREVLRVRPEDPTAKAILQMLGK